MMYSSHLLAVALMTLDIIINYNNTALVSAALLNISYKFADYLPMFISVYFKLHVCWLLSFTPVTYLCKLLGIYSVAAFLQLELFRV
ncbi:Uncharacterised protein [Yersinia enterocolitica]|nr:Uncharacterised protein [Yersinia enterocolitica]